METLLKLRKWLFSNVSCEQVVSLGRTDTSASLLHACACREMLSYTKSAVTRNAGEKKINSLLDFVSASTDTKLLQVWDGWLLLKKLASSHHVHASAQASRAACCSCSAGKHSCMLQEI